ncbi:MAG TPA: amidohydrolase family protein [Thermoanaerobaculia bacterium]|nr:amidohydrolase family protein [Thermoanaerobaculia bacterium]
MRAPLVAIVTLLATLAAPAQTVTAIRAAHMIDVRAGVTIDDAVVLVTGERITAAGAKLAIPEGARVIDLGARTLLPGLIDAHTHLLLNLPVGGDENDAMLLSIATSSTAKRALFGAKSGREVLQAGITTVRDLGNSGTNGDIALRDAINAGWIVGPRILASTRALAPPGGQYGPMNAAAHALIAEEYAIVVSVDDTRRAVQRALYDGADCIKVIVNAGNRTLSQDVMNAIVDEAHRAHRRVAAHAIGDLATRTAANAGVDSIEHAYTIPDDALKTMAEKKIALVPTDPPADVLLALTPAERVPSDPKKRDEQMALAMKAPAARLQRARAAGVKIVFGSDEYYEVPNMTRGQSSLATLRSYAGAGMSPLEILRAATVDSAELLGIGTRAGEIRKGFYADLIAVDGDPLASIDPLLHVSFVMKGGAVIFDRK